MKEHEHVPSLLPYLDPANGCTCLKIPVIPEDPSTLERLPSPFLIVTDTDPLTRLIGAQFETDSGCMVKRVFLLIQRDKYSVTNSQLAPITNENIEDFWQKAFDYYSTHNSDASFITLSRQISGGSRLLPFQSLFFCKSRRIFFHPPCPRCGLTLQLCRDDRFLENLGLQRYSSSIARYLYCSFCSSSEQQGSLYTYQPDDIKHPLVKDRLSLIREFQRLVAKSKDESLIPCLDCPQNGECYGPDGSAVSNIVPFSFYPFFMLVFESMPLNALDFLNLLSGASPDELQARLRDRGENERIVHMKESISDLQQKTPFLFKADDRFFLELLFLKLSFLAEIVQGTSSSTIAPGISDPLVSIDRTWVRLTDKSRLLPYFWNFELKFIDILRPPQEQLFMGKLPSFYSFHFLGLVWFHALLANSRQDTSRIYRVIEEVYDKTVADIHMPFDLDALHATEPTFYPENIFWNPEKRNVDLQWRSFWQEALDLGWSLLRASFHAGAGWTVTSFLKQVEKLRNEVRAELFAGKRDRELEEPSRDDEVIHRILTGIMKKWEKAQQKTEESQDISLETVVISSPSLDEEKTLPLGFMPKANGETIPETRIRSPEKPAEIEKSAAGTFQSEAMGEEAEEAFAEEAARLDKTVVIGAPPTVITEDIPETVVISPSKERKPSHELPSDKTIGRKTVYEEVHPSVEPTEPQESEEPKKKLVEDDLMMETIILTPQKGKSPDKDKKGPNE